MKQAITAITAIVICSAMTISAQAAGKGEQIFNQKCAMCHKVKGKGGAIGPELTKVSAYMKEADIIAQLENPKKKNPASSMPSFKALPKNDMQELLTHLKTLK